jgi:hypothetical protein
MASALLYLLTGCAAGFQILSQISFVVWGRPIAHLEIAALAGAAIVIVAACFAMSKPRQAARIAIIGDLLLLATTFHTIRKLLVDSRPVVRPRPWFIGVFCLLTVTISPLIGFSRTAPFNFTVPRKIVTVEMSWKRGDLYYGPNFISLESRCPNSSDSRCYCATDFTIINSKAFADDIQSFGGLPVPVKYEVFYNRDGEAISANLVSVGKWPGNKFHENEGGIGSGGTVRLGEPGLTSRTPADCFQRLSKH